MIIQEITCRWGRGGGTGHAPWTMSAVCNCVPLSSVSCVRLSLASHTELQPLRNMVSLVFFRLWVAAAAPVLGASGVTCRRTATSTRDSVDQQTPARRLVCPLALLLGAQPRHQSRPLGHKRDMREPGPVALLAVCCVRLLAVHCLRFSAVCCVRLPPVPHAERHGRKWISVDATDLFKLQKFSCPTFN